MSLTPDGRVTIPVDLVECKVELLGGRHDTRTELWVMAMCDEIEHLRAAWGLKEIERYRAQQRADQAEDRCRELERKQFVSST